MEFEWDADNLRHVLEERPRGVTPTRVDRIGNGEPRLFLNKPAAGRSGSHVMIGPDEDGRFWTIVLVYLSNETWRPITGSEKRLYQES